jgi:hypothetical protein
MRINLKPHPNYLKVIHSYIWLLYTCYLCFVLWYSSSTLFAVLAIISGLTIPFITLKIVLSSFIKKKFKITLSEIKSISFTSFFLEKAYGVGTVIINNVKLKGIHIDDFQKIIRCMES